MWISLSPSSFSSFASVQKSLPCFPSLPWLNSPALASESANHFCTFSAPFCTFLAGSFLLHRCAATTYDHELHHRCKQEIPQSKAVQSRKSGEPASRFVLSDSRCHAMHQIRR